MVTVPAGSSVVIEIVRAASGCKSAARRLPEPQFFTRIRRVGNQLANENLPVGVKRMDDNIQQLLNLGLKMVFFRRAHNAKKSNPPPVTRG
jgi:hypothetical protein